MRRLTLPTASSLERGLACPPSLVLPAIWVGVGDDAKRGSQIGLFVRDVLAREPLVEAIAKISDEEVRATCAALDFDAICGDLVDVRAEVAYAIDPKAESARFLGINMGRKYPTLRAGEYAGTNDLEGFSKSTGREVVCDLKSGREVTACRENAQMMFHALARFLVTGCAEVEARILYIREDGRVLPDVHVFTAFELELFLDSLVELQRRARQAARTLSIYGEVEVSSGPHCKYCPALQSCPAHVKLARSMGEELALTAGPDLEPAKVAAHIAQLSPTDAGAAWRKAKRIEKMLAVVLEGLKAYARQTPLILGDGKIVSEGRSHSSSFSQSRAVTLLRAKGATQDEIDALYTEITTSPIREVNEPKKTKGRKAA